MSAPCIVLGAHHWSWSWSTQPSLSLFVQPPSHLHRLLHRSPARWQLQFPFRQHYSHSGGAATSDRSVQYGTHSFVLVFHSQPHSLGFGISGVLERDCFQIKAATSRARLICWNKAFLVGGMEYRDFKLWENMSFASLHHLPTLHYSYY